MPVTLEALQRQAELDQALAGIVDQTERDLVRAWATAFDEIAGDLRDTLTAIASDYAAGDPIPRSAFARSTRLTLILAYVGEKLDQLAQTAGVRVVRDIHQVVTDAAGAQAQIISAMLPPAGARPAALSPTRIESGPLDAIVARTTQQITSRLKPLSPEAYDAVRRELIRGVAVGVGPRDVAQQMVGRAKGGFDGGLTRATTIARTEMLDAHRQAAAYAQQQHGEVLAGWVWLTHLSPSTCRSCIAQNGTLHQLSEPGPLDHQQGRCARMPATRSWADLGIDVEEPADQTPDAEAWFKGLTVKQQQAILGLGGYREWKAGRWPMAEWSQLRQTPGWRDSHVPAPPPKS